MISGGNVFRTLHMFFTKDINRMDLNIHVYKNHNCGREKHMDIPKLENSIEASELHDVTVFQDYSK